MNHTSESYLLVEELARFLLDGVNELYLSCRETHQQGHALRCGREVVEVMTSGLRSLVDTLVYGLAQVSSLKIESVNIYEASAVTFKSKIKFGCMTKAIAGVAVSDSAV